MSGRKPRTCEILLRISTFEVDLKIVWNVVQNDILYLIHHLELIVPAEDT